MDRDMEKELGDGLPPYTAVNSLNHSPKRRWRRSRTLKLVILTCLIFVVYAQWKQVQLGQQSLKTRNAKFLSFDRLEADLKTCAKIRHAPKDPGGHREKNPRYVEGNTPTLIRNGTVWVGEPVEGTSPEDARLGKGFGWITADIFVEFGLIKQVEAEISVSGLPEETQIWEANGRLVTTGIIDQHSHAGVDSLPSLRGRNDVNELTGDITPYVRSIDGINPLDNEIQVIKSGGVTTSLILPGSGNNIGGQAYPVKFAVGKPGGRAEISIGDLLIPTEWRYMKMACGENAKRQRQQGRDGYPISRLGEAYYFRHAFEQAQKYNRAQDDWCDAAESGGLESLGSYLPQELEWEALGAVLRGQVKVNTHCYEVADLEAFISHTNEFSFSLAGFHHSHDSFIVPELLKRAYGGPPASMLFSDNMYYKAESYDGSEFAAKTLYEAGLTPIAVSDSPVLNAQHVVYEAAKMYRYGLPYHAALAAVTTAPAQTLGLGDIVGKLKAGFDADIVVWDSDPLSVGATPVQVWIDGYPQFKDPVELKKPAPKPIVPDLSLSKTNRVPSIVEDVVFTNISRVFLSSEESVSKDGSAINVAVKGGKITCIGTCANEIQAASSDGKVVHLSNGYLTESFTAFGSTLGLNEIDAETTTDNGPNVEPFSRALDGLALGGKKLDAAYTYGVTKAISAPKFTGSGTHHGVSVGFLTGAVHPLEAGAVWGDSVSVHYTLTKAAKQGKTPSISSAVGALRKALLEAVKSNETLDEWSEQAYLKKVVTGALPLVLTVHSADTIAALLQVKSEVEAAITTETRESGTKLNVVILGGAESHLVAPELAAASVSVVLSPYQSYSYHWEERRSLYGAPLTNGTAIDVLVEAGVLCGIGLEEDWIARSLSLLAARAWKNGGGKLSEKEALDLISTNIFKMLGLDEVRSSENFVVFEGSPLEIEGRVKAVGGGQGKVTVYE